MDRLASTSLPMPAVFGGRGPRLCDGRVRGHSAHATPLLNALPQSKITNLKSPQSPAPSPCPKTGMAEANSSNPEVK